MIRSFGFAPTPQLHFGAGKISVLTSVLKPFGPRVLLVTGQRSFASSSHYVSMQDEMRSSGKHVEQVRIEKEPTPEMIDLVVRNFLSLQPDVVVSIGGGSVLDAGKAISAMLPLGEPVKDYLEGVGTKSHPGKKIPFVAVPTTAGTGSEATKNAVLSETGANGYKRSLRHNNFVPDLAIVDPTLTVSCSRSITAWSGMDAFTQLLESFLSTAASPLTDALALEGLRRIPGSLPHAWRDGSDLKARTEMSMASYLSGITLANAGLGLVHGFASSIGGYFDIPHGLICSSLMSAANKVTVRKLRQHPGTEEALSRYAAIGKLFNKIDNRSTDYYIDTLLGSIEELSLTMSIPTLSQIGVKQSDFEKIVAITENKNNPVPLEKDEMMEVLEMSG